MLFNLFFLTAFSFAVIHPLLFWTTKNVVLKNTFYRFNLTLCCVAGSFSVLGLFAMGLPWKQNPALLLWWLTLMGVSAGSWNRPTVHPVWVSLPCLLGIPLLFQLESSLLFPSFPSSFLLWSLSLLSALIYSASLYSGVLGHWYIEMKHLPVSHLNRVTNIFGFLLCARLLADGILLGTRSVLLDGDTLPLTQFILMGEGFFLWVALLFGTLFPFILIFFVRGTLKEGSHTSATGILYVIFISILIGDLTYKYYWAKHGVFL